MNNGASTAGAGGSSDDHGIYRSSTSYGDAGFSRYLKAAFLSGAGHDREDLTRPVIGITDLTSDYNPCHREMPAMIEHVKRGVLEAGGLPFVFPTTSLGESFLSPTSMLYRNMLAIETEELVTAQPMDAVVLLGGCDKTVPAQLMAAAVVDVPAIIDVVGPMATGHWRGERLGACTDCRRFWARHRAGELDQSEIAEIEGALVSTAGTCMVMGTASTMAVMAETLGMMLPGGASPSAPSGRRLQHATATGRRAVGLASEGTLAREILDARAFGNALQVLAAVGGSTNAVIHMLAIARRAGVELNLDDFDRVASETPLLVDLKPSGVGYMDDFDNCGGVPTLLRQLADRLHTDHVGVSGTPLGELLRRPSVDVRAGGVIRPLDDPVGEAGALVVLKGSLAPDGALLKVSAASPHLLRHTGPAVVFESPDDAARRLDDPDLEITPDHVLVLRNAGPVACGMPEAGSMAIPQRLAEQGVTDMLRVSDARMSGTSYGTVVLHCSPESAVGGPLSLVHDGDMICLDVSERRLDLLVDASELERRQRTFVPPALPERGWARLYASTVMQANLGADLDFLTSPVTRPGPASVTPVTIRASA